MSCPLCLGSRRDLVDKDKLRSYYRCHSCDLVFVERAELVSVNSERERYEAHENDEADQGYSNYLKEIAETVKRHLSGTQTGLDFGCGRSKLLASHLAPHEVQSYDIFFHPERELLTKSYDFIVLSEVIEHLRDPREEMVALSKLAPKIFVKTKFYPEVGFSTWFYKRDITHVQFFNLRSFEELAKICGFSSFEEIGKDLYVFKK